MRVLTVDAGPSIRNPASGDSQGTTNEAAPGPAPGQAAYRHRGRSRGTVYAPPSPLRGLSGFASSDPAYLHDFLTQNAALAGQPVILVGHSYGGAVITNAAVGNPEVKALVYVDAFIPAQGEALGDCSPRCRDRAWAGTRPACSTWCPTPAARPATSTPTSSRPWSPAASPAACPPARPRSSPPPSGRWPPARFPSRPARRPGRPSPPGP